MTQNTKRSRLLSQEIVFFGNWVYFFNEDPVEYLRDHAQGEFAKIEHDPKAQETLRQSFQRLVETLKEVIVAYEDFQQGLAPKDGLKRLQRAVEALNEMIELKVIYKMGVSNAGVVSFDPRDHGLVENDWTLKIASVSPFFLTILASHVVNFEEWMSRWQDRLPIGVCRYEKCRKFFVKDRTDKRYCGPHHRNADWVSKHRRRGTHVDLGLGNA